MTTKPNKQTNKYAINLFFFFNLKYFSFFALDLKKPKILVDLLCEVNWSNERHGLFCMSLELQVQPDSRSLIVFSDPSSGGTPQVASIVQTKPTGLVVHLYGTYTNIVQFPTNLKKAIFRPIWLDNRDGRYIYLKRGYKHHTPLLKTVKNANVLVESFPLNQDETLPANVFKHFISKRKKKAKANGEMDDDFDGVDDAEDSFCHKCEACSEMKPVEEVETVESLAPSKLRKGDRGIVRSNDHFLKVRVIDSSEDKRYLVSYENVPSKQETWISADAICARIPPKSWQLKRIGAEGSLLLFV